MKKLVVVNDLKAWKIKAPAVELVSAIDYLTDSRFAESRNFRVFNLCDHYHYQSRGYYVSLLALARGHFVIPSARTVLDLQNFPSLKVMADELEDLFQRKLKRLKSNKFTLSIYFGKNLAKQYDEIARELSKLFPAPLLRAHFARKRGQWQLQNISPISIAAVDESHLSFVNEAANEYFNVRRHRKRRSKLPVFSLAILVNEQEVAPPSNERALKKFIKLGDKVGFEVELIGPREINRIAAFDALFIREDTNVHHHTYRFACRAEAEGVAVIDTPEAILRCNNKVFLTELLRTHNIPTPHTAVLSRRTLERVSAQFEFPLVLKLPDSSSSRGVEKISSFEELKARSSELFKRSELLLAQEYTPTDFDWRIGILDHTPLFACKYYMARGHWQIYNWSTKRISEKEGSHQTLPIEQVPADLIEAALASVTLIGDGLFGVDLKVLNGKPVVIEVNENPNIDAGVEDQVLGDELYLAILGALRQRVDLKYLQLEKGYERVS